MIVQGFAAEFKPARPGNGCTLPSFLVLHCPFCIFNSQGYWDNEETKINNEKCKTDNEKRKMSRDVFDF